MLLSDGAVGTLQPVTGDLAKALHMILVREETVGESPKGASEHLSRIYEAHLTQVLGSAQL